MSRFFINRPIFAWVIAIIMMLVGIMAVTNLPIEQYPKIAPPTITVNAMYPGADAQTVEDSVVQIIEQRMKGLDGLMYMSSTSSSSGTATVTLTFETGTDADTAQVQVQNKLQSATSLLPESVQRQGVNVAKSSGNFMTVFAFISKDGSMTNQDIGDYVNSSIVDQISRVEGVGDVRVFGSSYAMRIWLDPARLRAYQLMPSDVVSAVRSQNAQVSAGQLGQLPVPIDETNAPVINATVTVQSYLQTAEEFEQILLKTNTEGGQVRLKDVARVELGSENYGTLSKYNGNQASGIGISLATGANALDTRQAVQDKMDELERNFPAGLKAVVPYDTTPFVRLSIQQVIMTLLEASVLVFLVMLLFLQNWRATIVPTLTVPVVILGTFAVLYVFGFSINVLTMFAMVLSIGLLVDDAIVVVENVERILEEEPDISVKDATLKSMREITRVLIGIAVMLTAVFLPMAFFGGSTGVIYRQFAVTLITSMILSTIIAIIYTPAVCATLLRRKELDSKNKYKGIFGWFNQGFDKFANLYIRIINKGFQLKWLYAITFAGLIVLMSIIFVRIPSSFLPEEDQGIMFTLVQLPAGSTANQTEAVLDKVRNYYMTQEEANVEGVFTVAGFSFGGAGQNMGIAFVRLADWDSRIGTQNSAQAVAGRATGYFMSQINEASAFAIVPPAITELGNASGFDLMLQDTGNVGHETLLAARNQLLGMAAQNESVVGVRPSGQEDAPTLDININQDQAAAYGLPFASINSVISTAWGGAYVNDFIDRGRIKRVYIQGEPASRATPEDINKWYVRNTSGQMIPFSAFSNPEWTYGSPRLTRYNSFPSMNIQGSAAPGLSSGDAMTAMSKLIEQLPDGISFEWTGLSLEEQKSGSQAPLLYAISILVVFLCLAALYESWTIPISVLLVIPLGVLGVAVFTWLRQFANDVYLQVGLLTVIGLSAKNAMLIVEFAKEYQEAGYSLKESVLTAAKQRLRPIVMTSLAFGMGVVPLFIATGAGSGSQTAIGTSVLGGVISATVLGIFFIPMFYIWIRSIFPYKRQT